MITSTTTPTQPRSKDGKTRRGFTTMLRAGVVGSIIAGTIIGSAAVASAGVPNTSGVCESLFTNNVTSLAPNPVGPGYWSFIDSHVARTDGQSFAVDGAPNLGTAKSDSDIIRATPDGKGYYAIDQQGDISSFGDAAKFKTLSQDGQGFDPWGCGLATKLNTITGAAVTPDGKGLWILDDFGQIFTVGDAHDYGQAYHLNATSDAIDIVGTPDGGGYTVLFANGTINTLGDAHNFGTAGVNTSTGPIVAMATTPDDGGYWILSAQGTVWNFGNAPALPALPALSGHGNQMYTDMAPTTGQGNGYDVINEAGIVTTIAGPPVAHSASFVDMVGQSEGLSLTAASGDPITKYTIVTPPANGSISGFNPATGALTYTPSTDFEGNDTFTYTATNAHGTSQTATVTVTMIDSDNTHHTTAAHTHSTTASHAR